MKSDQDRRAYLAQVEECLACLEMALCSDGRERTLALRILRMVVEAMT